MSDDSLWSYLSPTEGQAIWTKKGLFYWDQIGRYWMWTWRENSFLERGNWSNRPDPEPQVLSSPRNHLFLDANSWGSQTDRGDLHLAFWQGGKNENKQFSSFKILFHKRAVQSDNNNKNHDKKRSNREKAGQSAGKFQKPSIGHGDTQILNMT